MAQLGTVFQIIPEGGNHFWFVISHEKDGLLLAVNVTDAVNCPDSTCVLNPGDHPAIVKPSAVYYRKARLFESQKIDALMTKKIMKATLTAKERSTLKSIAAEVDARTKQAFQSAFAAWKKTWFEGGLAISSDPHTRTVGREFDALVALGPKILPLLVERLTEPDNFLALQLYDTVQPSPRLIVQFEPDDERILSGEQGRAQEVVKQWLASHQVAA